MEYPVTIYSLEQLITLTLEEEMPRSELVALLSLSRKIVAVSHDYIHGPVKLVRIQCVISRNNKKSEEDYKGNYVVNIVSTDVISGEETIIYTIPFNIFDELLGQTGSGMGSTPMMSDEGE